MAAHGSRPAHFPGARPVSLARPASSSHSSSAPRWRLGGRRTMYAVHYPAAAQVAVIGVLIPLYLLPALVAYINRRKHARAIMLLNLSLVGLDVSRLGLGPDLGVHAQRQRSPSTGSRVRHWRSLDYPSMRPKINRPRQWLNECRDGRGVCCAGPFDIRGRILAVRKA